ncbi:hypothetical protein GGR58DRAFT_493732 [Xylaria digitata]|nr:hypothetical protein GGR58DRAFT_493732 [Xylaria digitata]
MDTVYQGIWTNWSGGPVFGLTVTTTDKYGNFIIAFMALFIAFVASRFWKITCIALHRAFSTTESRDTLHHQRQVILRNASSPGSGLSAFLCLLLAWRGTSIRRHLRIWPLIILASVCLLGFMFSGSIFSTVSTVSSNDVLRICFGSEYDTRGPNFTYEYSFNNSGIISDLVDNSSLYANCCYNNTGPCFMPCGFVARHLPRNETNSRAECPFQGQICTSTNANLRLDTGYIDSNDHIGLNAPASERFAWRYVLHCAPLKTDNYTSYGVRGNDSVTRYHYGTRIRSQTQGPSIDDYVLENNDVDAQYSFTSAEHSVHSSSLNFGLNVLRSRRINGHVDPDSDFHPIAELARTDGDIIIAFLSGNGVLFSQALDDDWYQATVPIAASHSKQESDLTVKYRPLNAASPMGCVQQMQWCNPAYPRGSGCGPLASTYDAFVGAAPFFNLTSDEVHGVNSLRPFSAKATGARLIWAALAVFDSPASSLDRVIATLGARSLASQVQFDNGVQWPIPVDQWQDDVRHWWETALASVQATFLRITMATFSQAPLTKEEIKMCRSQKHRSTRHTSFSVFSLSFIIALGVVTISTSYVLEPLLSCLSKRHKKRQYANLEWVTNGALQLHRLAHEEHGQSSWSHCDQGIPINDAEALLPSFDISDPEHPMLP